MTEIAQELLEDVKEGDYVCIRYGTEENPSSVEGIIVKWTDNFLHLRKRNGGIAKIRLDDSLRSLDPMDEGEAVRSSGEAVSGAEKPVEKPGKEQREKPEARKHSVMRQMVNLPAAQPYSFLADDWIEVLKKMARKLDNPVVRNLSGGVLDSFASAVKNKEVKYKYHDLRARVHAFWEQCENDSDFVLFYLLLGILAIGAGDFAYALEPLVRAGKYTLAAYAATSAGLADEAEVFSVCALLNQEKESSINRYISEICIKRNDAEVLEELLSLYRDSDEAAERIASCAYMMYTACGGSLADDITPYNDAYQAAVQFLRAVPDGWKKSSRILERWKEYRGYTFPAPVLSAAPGRQEMLSGKVYEFKNEKGKNWGFLSAAPDEAKHFFYIAQVRDDTETGILLRKLLALGMAEQLEVSFCLGENARHDHRSSASSVDLTPKGYSQALRRIEGDGGEKQQKTGFVEQFDANQQSGVIQSDGRRYRFKTEEVTDPYLRAYYRYNYAHREQDVVFEIRGKNSPCRICWRNPAEDDYEAAADEVSPEEAEQWEAYLKTPPQEPEEIALPEADPYQSYPYQALPEWQPAGAAAKRGPLSWGGGVPAQAVRQAQQKKAAEEKVSPKPAAPQAPPTGESKVYSERARKAMQEGRYKEAEADYAKALEVGGFHESIVCDFITLYLRQEGKVDSAVKLLEEYGGQVSAEKLLNLKIQVYDKKKDFETLCPLYEEAFRTTASISKKSHNLHRLIDAYMKLEKFAPALDACRRWESFYQQNRFRSDSAKMKKMIPVIERQKAICYYHLGQVEEARRIATDLIRSNPADAAANSILNGTLAASSALEDLDSELYLDETDSLAEEESGGSGSRMSRFVRNMIQQTDIATSLKSLNLKDGKYIGSSAEALDDVKKLVSRRRSISSRTRSESLFAACKLVEQIEQRSDGAVSNAYYKYRLAGRAMASWGDYMVSQSSQNDTIRMAYLFSMKVLTPTRNGAEQDWINSYNRYIKSFFMARVGKDSLDSYINQQANSSAKDGINTDVLANSQIPDVLLSEFLVGTLQLVAVLKKQTDRQKALMEDLYSQNVALRESLCQRLGALIGETVPGNVGFAEFSAALIEGCRFLNRRMNLLNDSLTEAVRVLLTNEFTEEMLASLEGCAWKNCLTATDAVRLTRIYNVLRRLQDYFGNSEFENRADCLRATILEVKELLQAIQNEPTDVSYDIFLPALEQMAMTLADRQSGLYQDFQPRISWRESLKPFRTPEGHIQIQLIVENELNYQSADSVQITDIRGSEITWSDRGSVISNLRGGETAEVGLAVAIAESADLSGSFSLTLEYSYKYNDSPESVITKNQEAEFTFVIYNEDFVPLRNPFMAYEGKKMEDASMFYGRSHQIDQIVDLICPGEGGPMNYGRAIAMYGQTRTGKSSLMFHLKKQLNEKYGDRVIIWDIENIGDVMATSLDDYFAGFLYNMLYVGNEALGANRLVGEAAREEGLFAPLEEILEQPAFAVTYFNTYMRKLNRILQAKQCIIVLLVDEFTYLHNYIREGKISSEFMRFWKALLQNYCIFAVVAGQDDMPEFMREYQNEFACMELMKLTYLDELYAKQLIQEPLERENHREGLFRKDGSVNEIYNLTAGSAYLTIVLCSKLVNYLNEKGAYVVTKGIVEDFLRKKAFGPNSFLTEVHFEAQLQERGHREYDAANKEILLSVARRSQMTGYADIEGISCSGMTREEIQGLVDRLVDRDVLVREGRNQYWIQVRLLERWLISTMGV